MTSLFSPRRPVGTWPLAVIAATLALAGTARGQTAPVAKNSGKELTLTHISTFDAPPNGTRSPFWPIGWVPSAAPVAAQGVVQQLDVKAEQFSVTTISVDYPPLAIINGKSYGVGDQIPVTADRRVFVTVRQILDGVVVLDYQGHELRAMTGAATLTRKAK